MHLNPNGDDVVALTPGEREASSHRGTVNDWLHVGNRDRLVTLADALGLPTATPEQIATAQKVIADALAPYSGEALTALEDDIRSSIQIEIDANLEPSQPPTDYRSVVPIDVTFDGS
jgi:hypothetical protein